jgi:cellulose synthase/poly-beta-1,6-N-acetylglucosamine synthase-like glycosyltransferase
VIEILFWLALAVPVYAYFGYPLVLAILSLFIHRPIRKAPFSPRVSLLIPAYREAQKIQQKIRNSLELDYPPEQLEIVVACDGSPDDTPDLARAAAAGNPRVRVLDYPVNRGKIGVLNASVPELSGEIIVFSDATAMLYPNALRKVMANFADASVGAVCGKYTVIKPEEVAIGKSEDVYWKYESYLKAKESGLSSTLGGPGQLNAIRKALYPFPPLGTINDDYVIPTSVLAHRYRAVYEPEAILHEDAQEMTGFGRRVRIMAGNIQQISYLGGVLRPFQPLPLLFFLSHKVMRLLVPFAMIVLLLTNLMLLDQPLYRVLGAGQALFYLLAIAGSLWKLRPRLLAVPYYFTMINMAVFAGLYYAIVGLRRMSWK